MNTISNLIACVHFNSIKVRLELWNRTNKQKVSQFQFHKGAIRTLRLVQAVTMLRYFNSIKVRLEPSIDVQKLHQNLHFNSIKVRLERDFSLRPSLAV